MNLFDLRRCASILTLALVTLGAASGCDRRQPVDGATPPTAPAPAPAVPAPMPPASAASQ